MMLPKTKPAGRRLILTDDMGYGDPYHAGGIVPPPAIDTLGPEQRNDGNIRPFNKRVTELLPELTF